MTREERDKAIRVLEDMKVKIDIPKAAVMQNNKNWALDMAIKELQQQTCEDAISREEAIDAVADLFEMSEYPHPYPQGKPIRLRDIKEKLKQLPPVTPRSLNPEADREESKAYCAECDHIEMCSWYPHDGCEWLKTDRYNAGYNAAKREIALSGEYERAYERGKADAHPDINDGKLSEIPTSSESEDKE